MMPICYFTGERVEVGDYLTTDNGNDLNRVLFVVDKGELMVCYGVDHLGVFVYSEQCDAVVFLLVEEIVRSDTKFLNRGEIMRHGNFFEMDFTGILD